MAVLKGRVLAIGGSDPSGGAGIEADIKTIAAFGAYAEAAITAITVQDTKAVYRIEPMAPDLVAAQVGVVLDDLGADAIKTGMIPNAAVVRGLAAALCGPARHLPLVIDPVLGASSGRGFLDAAGIAALKSEFIPLCALLTPNVPEAETLSGIKIADEAAMERAGRALLALGAKAVLVKGGHLAGVDVADVLVTERGVETFRKPRQKARHSHGTGCTLASGIATGLAQGLDLKAAIARAEDFIARALRTAPGFGHGRGPLNHACLMA